MQEEIGCPFKVGDIVRFTPDEHAYGWTWPSFEDMRLRPGDTGTITCISQGKYIYLDDGRGRLHWQCFTKVEEE